MAASTIRYPRALPAAQHERPHRRRLVRRLCTRALGGSHLSNNTLLPRHRRRTGFHRAGSPNSRITPAREACCGHRLVRAARRALESAVQRAAVLRGCDDTLPTSGTRHVSVAAGVVTVQGHVMSSALDVTLVRRRACWSRLLLRRPETPSTSTGPAARGARWLYALRPDARKVTRPSGPRQTMVTVP